MSTKRAATSELNHDNWDQDDPSEHEEMGTFKPASKDVLEKRVIKTAKRRSQITSEEGKKGVFSGFGGFNKTEPSSFDFLSNLTNGNKTTTASKSDTLVTSSLFSNKTLMKNTSGGIFGTESTSASNAKPTFGFSTQPSSLFGSTLTSTQTSTSIFTASKADSTVGDNPLSSQPPTSATEPVDSTKTTSVTGSVMSPTLFGVSSSNTSSSKTLFSTTTTSSPFKMQPATSSSTVQSTFGTASTVSPVNSKENNIDTVKEEKRIKYYSKLKGLNESVSDWIKKHVEETPLCILSPIFKDYEKYLKEMQDEFHSTDDETKANESEPEKTIDAKSDSENDKAPKGFSVFSSNTSVTSKADTAKLPAFGASAPTLGNKPSFTFGIKASESTPLSSSGFTFGINTSTPTSTKTSNLFSTTSTANTNGGTPFSFGTSAPFSFNSKIQKPETESTNNDNEEDEPPKVDFTPVVEENSVFDKKCKIFVKKDGNFVDKGVATLYVKKIEESGKHQLLVRANTNLGNIILNLILVSAIPTQRMGKNNVMMVCIPTPDSKPPPVPILIRVKTSEEADELLQTLDKYKS